jgi:hypothetical protein
MGLYLVPSETVLAHRLYHRRGLLAPGAIDWQQAIPWAELPVDTPLEAIQPATTDQLSSVLYDHDHDQDSEFGLQENCAMCVETTSQISRETETRANAILSEFLPSLTIIQWMGWLTPGHLGVNSYDMQRPA